MGLRLNPSLTLLFEPGFFHDWSKSTDLNTNVTQSHTFNGLYSTSQSKFGGSAVTNLETSSNG